MKALLVSLLVSCISQIVFAQTIAITPLEIIHRETAYSLYSGAVIVGSGSWVKRPSLNPEDTVYDINFRAYVTTEGLFLNDSEKLKMSQNWPLGKIPQASELGMDIQGSFTLTETLETPRCLRGVIMLVFGESKNIISQKMICKELASDMSARNNAVVAVAQSSIVNYSLFRIEGLGGAFNTELSQNQICGLAGQALTGFQVLEASGLTDKDLADLFKKLLQSGLTIDLIRTTLSADMENCNK